MEHFILKTVGTIKVNGKTIRCMGLVNFIMKMEQLPMKDIGKMMSLMGKAGSTTQNQSYSKDNLTTKTFLSWEINGFIMKDYSKTILNMEKVI